MTGDEIVISGISGKFPSSENINELQKNLLNKTDCVTVSKARWDCEHPQIPPRIGVMKKIDTFDSLFFGVHKKLADRMDPMFRLIMETTYEAITDAGINPRKLRGSKTAVFTGSTFAESEKAVIYNKKQPSGYGMMGAGSAMLANRISFYFDTTGPSMNIDSSCCGGTTVLQEGYRAIKDGRAENAIIGASNVVLHPHMSVQLFLLGLLSPDGITKSFDNAADGYTRSEGCVVLFLQKARHAKRIYAEIKNAPSLMKTVLSECGLKGNDVSYVEADGSGIKDIDAEEVKAIDQVYNEGRKSPLLIGSVKSNLGSCSAVNALNGIIKVITAMETGYIPPNLHFENPSNIIPALIEGRCKVVTELTLWTGDYAIVNCLALTGSSANIILKDFKKQKKNEGTPDDNLPRLVTVSGRTEEAVDVLLTDLESRPVDVEMLQLLYDIFETEIPANLIRGYTLLPSKGLPKTKMRNIELNTSIKREIWYMFSGMGSQWLGMGKHLLHIPIFMEAINKCNRVLQPRGIDIVRIITEEDSKIYDNILNSFVGIAAIQIGLVDLLTAIGLKPDFVIGHSVGELGCAYADNCFTAEQMILSAFYRGLASIETKMPKGSMAAVGLGYEKIKKLCPPDIDVACHNSDNSSTISGPADSMKSFIAHLKANKIFAKEVAVGNIAYHSRYIVPAGEKLIKYLHEVIPDPKPRSQRWISSSVPYDDWNSAKARFSSAEYHTNNLLNSVLFAESAKLIPSNAIVIEIAPHGLLQAIVKKSLPQSVINIPLTNKNHPDGNLFLFDALGKIYNAGCSINVSNLYPKISYPVSRGTPSISSLIRWDHSNKCYTRFFKQQKELKAGEMNFTINLKEANWEYLKHARINDKIVICPSVYLNLAWQVLKLLKKNSEFSVVYHDVQIYDQVEITEEKNTTLVVMVQKATGFFEVSNNEVLQCSGIIKATDNPELEFNQVFNTDNYLDLSESDVYKELQIRGFQYSGPFKTIFKASTKNSNGILIWKNDWTTFLEGMIQIYVLGSDIRNTQVPIKIRKIVINMKLQQATVKSREIPVIISEKRTIVNAGGIQIEGIILKSVQRQDRKNRIFTEKLQIVSCTDGALCSLLEILKITLQFLKENLKNSRVIRIVGNKIDVEKIKQVLQIILGEEIKKFKIDVVSSRISESNSSGLLVLCNTEQQTLKDQLNLPLNGSFLLILAEPKNESLIMTTANSAKLGLVVRKYSSNDQVALIFRKLETADRISILDIKDWDNQVRTILNLKDRDKLIITIRSKDYFNLSKILQLVQKEQKINNIQIVDIQDPKVSKFFLDDSDFRSRMDLNLKLNILLPDKIWGMYQYFPISSNLRQVSNWIARQHNGSDLESISWVEEYVKKSENTIKVEYSSLNEQDIFLATAKITLENTRLETKLFGQEYSGIDLRGNRVMGITQSGAFSKFTSSVADYTWKIPSNWSLEDAATVPLAYTIAYLSIVIKGELKNNESVFVFDGSCSIGQAILNLALNIKSHVFSGYANCNAKKFLENNYSNIQILNTVDSFPEEILSLTKGNRVNLVIYNGNDLSKLEDCLKFVNHKGKVIVIGNLQDSFNKSIGMQIFDDGVKVLSIIPTKLINLDVTMKRKLSQMIVNGIETGIVKPLPKRVYSREMLTNAFIDTSLKSFFEKIIVKIQPNDGNNKALALPRFICKSEASYLIIEGLSYFGLELVDFLVSRGAKNIVIVSEAKNTGLYSNSISMWKQYGVSVVVHEKVDLSHRQSFITLFKQIHSLGTIDAIFDLQRIENLSTRSESSKYIITKYAFEESKQICSNLRQFIIFTTCKDIGENIEDVLLRENYLSKIFQEHSKETFPGLLILLGPISGIVEYTTETKRNGHFFIYFKYYGTNG
ncbi:fatty acid synthase-like [Leptopilina boulardi]|uniref:fatty acid synthase-like n=1 Tax=Leptopilina boulardi TaxID=63433 RepID=UPI0021F56E5F|nr:fatty acid synthase-like [Leptopilina boulardi]